MPVYRWDVIAADDFRWLRERARRSADLYDGYRVDHLVGFYRTYGRPHDGGRQVFTPADEPQQIALGERVLDDLSRAGAEIIAEDLGTRARLRPRLAGAARRSRVPRRPVGAPLAHRRSAVQGPRQLSGPFGRDVGHARYRAAGRLVGEAPREERERIARVPTVAALADGLNLAEAPYIPQVRDVLLESLFASGSDLVLIPIQDVFGWRDRINVPATVNDLNWTYRLPWPVDVIDDIPAVRERRDRLRSWAIASGRVKPARPRQRAIIEGSWPLSIHSARCVRVRPTPRASPPCPTTSSTPTKRGPWPTATR